jgi:hypothetical protein
MGQHTYIGFIIITLSLISIFIDLLNSCLYFYPISRKLDIIQWKSSPVFKNNAMDISVYDSLISDN